MSNLGEFIAGHRLAKKFSSRKLAEIAHISHTEVHRLENGERKNPSPPVLKAIANALEVSFEEIMQASGYMDDDTSSLPVIKERIFDTEDLSEQEISEVRNFIEFLRSKRKKEVKPK